MDVRRRRRGVKGSDRKAGPGLRACPQKPLRNPPFSSPFGRRKLLSSSVLPLDRGKLGVTLEDPPPRLQRGICWIFPFFLQFALYVCSEVFCGLFFPSSLSSGAARRGGLFGWHCTISTARPRRLEKKRRMVVSLTLLRKGRARCRLRPFRCRRRCGLPPPPDIYCLHSPSVFLSFFLFPSIPRAASVSRLPQGRKGRDSNRR